MISDQWTLVDRLEWLAMKGSNSYSHSSTLHYQVIAYIMTRFIGVERKSLFQMRCALRQWLTLAYKPIVLDSVDSVSPHHTNFQNQRLALLALQSVKSLQTSDFAHIYRSLLH